MLSFSSESPLKCRYLFLFLVIFVCTIPAFEGPWNTSFLFSRQSGSHLFYAAATIAARASLADAERVPRRERAARHRGRQRALPDARY